MPQVTFVHTSKNIDGNPNNLLLPIGLVALGTFLKQHKIETEIIHLEIEEEMDADFDLCDYLKSKDSHIVCLDLHWHYNSYKVIQLAKKIKTCMPTSHIILGGFTASFFAEEIMENYKEIDFIIRGDSEIPLLELIRSINNEAGFNSVQNIVWRTHSGIVKNPHTYIITSELINGMIYSNFSILKNKEKYAQLRLNNKEHCAKNSMSDQIFFYNCGRGCPVNCSFCGGSNISQKIINNRKEVIMIEQRSVIRELNNLVKNNFFNWYTCFDPYPNGDYYIKLFRKIRNLNLGLHFECWALPTRKFIDEFEKCFHPHSSKLIISPESGSDSVRKLNKGFFYSNKELLETLRYIETRNIQTQLYFTTGLPNERRKDILKTLILINFIRNNFKNVIINCSTIEYEPASPWFLDRHKYDITSNRKNFKDFYELHKTKSDIGYNTKYLSKEDINSALTLLVAESKCVHETSFFLETLSNDPTKLENISQLLDLCKSCRQFHKCF
ncbi:radical SAM protein [Candidatus Woesearchaeota archaeon]|nr:radical SAM protein [Candidatus Woesearchaeota archaeon]